MSDKQPYNMLPENTDTSLVLSVLNSETTLGSDYSAYGNDLTEVGDYQFDESGGLVGDGASAYLRKAVSGFQQTDYSGAIEFWLKRATYGAPQGAIFISTDEAGADNIFAVYISSNNIYLVVKNAGTSIDNSRSITQTIPAGVINHFMIASDASAYYFYMNGEAVGVTAHIGSNNGAWIGTVVNRDSIVVGADLSNAGTTAYLPDGDVISGLNYYSEYKSASFASKQFQRGVPDPSLVFHTNDGVEDLSRYRNTLTNYGATLGKMSFDGTNDKIDCGDIGNINTISFWINPNSNGEQILQIDTNKHIVLSGGTVTYTGVTATATYVNGTATTTYKGNWWQNIICVMDTVDANNFELGWNGTDYGQIKLDEVKAFNEIKTAGYAKQYYEQTKGLY